MVSYVVYGKFLGMRIFILSCLLFVAFTTQGLASGPIDGAARVHDGDTIRIGKTSIRIWGIDAVELKQTCLQNGATVACGMIARDALIAIIDGRDVTCIPKGKSYKRIVGQCFVGGRDVAAEMARLGMAYDYARYSHGYYSEAEAEARQAANGIWAMEAARPDAWRACHLRAKDKRPLTC